MRPRAAPGDVDIAGRASRICSGNPTRAARAAAILGCCLEHCGAAAAPARKRPRGGGRASKDRRQTDTAMPVLIRARRRARRRRFAAAWLDAFIDGLPDPNPFKDDTDDE